jgi:hypothetical protein
MTRPFLVISTVHARCYTLVINVYIRLCVVVLLLGLLQIDLSILPNFMMMLSMYLCIYLSICLPIIYLSVYVSVYLSIYLSSPECLFNYSQLLVI